MKKTALTFGLFSLVMVATSFAAPQTITYSATSDTLVGPGDGTVSGGIIKKHDFHAENNQSLNRQLNFANVNQSIRADKKVD